MTNPMSAAAGVRERRRIRRDDNWKAFADKIRSLTATDEQSMYTWIATKTRFYNRRHARFGKDGAGRSVVNYPWPGAANHNVPLSDMSIDELLGPLINVALPPRKIVQFVAMDQEGLNHVADATQAMEHLLRYRMGDRGVPDYRRQVSYSAESFLQHGKCVDKVFYSYLVEEGLRTFTKDDLPSELSRIQVIPAEAMDEMTRQQLAQQADVLVLTPEEFDDLAPKIRLLIVGLLELDTSDKRDSKAADEMLRWLKTDRTTDLALNLSYVVEDTPRVVNVPIQDIIVPSGTRHMENASRLTHDMYLSEVEFLAMAEANDWNDSAVNQILETTQSARRSSEGDTLWDALRRRTNTLETGPDADEQQIRISQTFAVQVQPNKSRRRVVITHDRISGVELDASLYDYEHGSWPFVDSNFEQSEADYFAPRGIPQKLEDIERYTTALARHQLNLLSMEVPTWTYRTGSGFNPNKHRWVPGMFIPRNRPDDVLPVPVQKMSQDISPHMFTMMSMADRIAGTRQNHMVRDARLFEPPTKADVDERSTQFESSLGLRASFFQDGRERIYRQVWGLWRQYGPEEFFVQVAGHGLRSLSQNKIRGSYRIVPVGAVGDMDSNARLQMEMTALDIIVKAQPYLAQDVRYVVDIPQKIKDILDLLDPFDSDRIMKVRSPEEQQQLLQMQQAEAERMQKLKETAVKLQQAVPTTEEEDTALLKEIRTISPHRDLQPILVNAEGAKASARNQTTLAAMNNGQA